MAHEVIMPALGMAQETGVIVAWHKQAGDTVAAGEVLMEVETDKSVMEVEAGADGYVAELRAEAGAPIPVGDVVAVITPEKPASQDRATSDEKTEERAALPEPEPAATKEPEASPQPAVAGSAPSTVKAPARTSSGNSRILASPKAKRLAAERGLDLGRLVTAGHPQPYHVADLEQLAALPGPSHGATLAYDRIEARVPAKGYSDFLAWLEAETDRPADPLAVLAAFAAGAWRAAYGAKGKALVVAAERPGDRQMLCANPDLCGLSSIEETADEMPDLKVRDLTASRITAMRICEGSLPVLTVAGDGDDLALALEFASGALDAGAAIDLISGMAARLEEPLRNLL